MNKCSYHAFHNRSSLPGNSTVIRLEFYPAVDTEWIREGEDFLVAYTLKRTGVTSDPFAIARMEGTTKKIESTL